MILAGCAASMRPRDWLSWLPLGAAGLLCYGAGTHPREDVSWMVLKSARSWYAAVPNSWDSFQLLGGVTGVVAIAAAAFTRLPIRVVLSLMVAMTAFYFSGILASVLSPPPTPYLVDQYWRRVTRFHSQFLYINNAYHFYSPEPGPPSELWILLKYKPLSETDAGDAGPAEPDTEWVILPRRNRDTMDPMRLSFYRRIALAEQVAQLQQGYSTPFADELQKANLRRLSDLRRIPKGNVPENQQFLQPTDAVVRQTLPSFAHHFGVRYGRPGREVASVKIYRVLHEVLGVDRFRSLPYPQPGPGSAQPARVGARGAEGPGKDLLAQPVLPDPVLRLLPGEYDMKGALLDPTDPELYWLIPIEDRKTYEPTDKLITAADFDRYFIDYVSTHAGSKRPKE